MHHTATPYSCTHLTWIFFLFVCFVFHYIYFFFFVNNVEGYGAVLFDLIFDKSQVASQSYAYRVYTNIWQQIYGIKLMWAKDYYLFVYFALFFSFFFISLFIGKGNKVFPRLANWNNNVVVLLYKCEWHHSIHLGT